LSHVIVFILLSYISFILHEGFQLKARNADHIILT